MSSQRVLAKRRKLHAAEVESDGNILPSPAVFIRTNIMMPEISVGCCVWR